METRSDAEKAFDLFPKTCEVKYPKSLSACKRTGRNRCLLHIAVQIVSANLQARILLSGVADGRWVGALMFY